LGRYQIWFEPACGLEAPLLTGRRLVRTEALSSHVEHTNSKERRLRVMFLIVSWVVAYWAFWAFVLYNVL